ncbi:DUF2238 domain-containing protein [Candidatus Falkowbacteria bacterium]|nr:DUF2238 domain-containing protein [Candidatus Falkowbacteria bacterium]
MEKNSKYHIFLLSATMAVMFWSGIRPHDYFTWILEVFPGIIGIAILLGLYRKLRLSNLLYSLIALHIMVLAIGGHYTYAEMPLFNWLRDTLGLARNYYDRLGHLMQGLVPALIAREIFLRRQVVKPGAWLGFFMVASALTVSVFYEFIEWWVAVGTGTAAEAFLGTQGDVWDTQWDMFMALLGSLAAIAIFTKLHDKSLNKLEKL